MRVNRRGEPGLGAVLALALIGVVTLVALGMILPIGQELIVSTGDSIAADSGWSATENATLATIADNVQVGMSLYANAPLLAAAGGIIGLIVVAFGVVVARSAGGL